MVNLLMPAHGWALDQQRIGHSLTTRGPVALNALCGAVCFGPIVQDIPERVCKLCRATLQHQEEIRRRQLAPREAQGRLF